MHALWHWILWMLTALSSDPADIDAERARAAGCVNVAYAALAVEPPAPPVPDKPKAAPVCKDCNGTGRIYRPDGGFVRCQCGACASGTCKAKSLP